ncbi:hypothetical protein [Lederbergia galactosidilytica]|uniref:Uncharacterized protein n=1 Tax=Lederbergia galactosidilytica TaxID=217031 RepID=A0A177ZR25_9BACI|nr:hypothetical protein [Lederbergia galactosidilytica]OAK70053.1 hypothetical protein ABB05_12775 [Lederbergia galactosidilytica]
MQITFTQDELTALATEIKDQLIPVLVKEIKTRQELPPLLTRTEFMELVGISATKCAELFNRRDFPVNREFGHPRVPTDLLFEWINKNTDWIDENAPRYPYRAI